MKEHNLLSWKFAKLRLRISSIVAHRINSSHVTNPNKTISFLHFSNPSLGFSFRNYAHIETSFERPTNVMAIITAIRLP